MNREVLFSLSSGFRDDTEITGYRFGKGERAACVVGAMRGTEYQQLYICSQLIDLLARLEEKGEIVNNKEILVIPCINSNSMNIGKRNWVRNNADLNRQFPGNPNGEAPDKIAAAVMEAISGYNYGIQFASFYLEGEFIPHVRMMGTGHESTSLANLFGLPYVLTAQPRTFDNRTLNYNWQLSGTNAFSIYTSATEHIDEALARQAVSSVMRFLTRMGIVKYNCHNGYIASVLAEEDLLTLKSNSAGFIRRLKAINQEIRRGDILAEVIHPYEGNIIDRIVSPVDGILFFAQTSPLLFQHAAAFKIIKKLHE